VFFKTSNWREQLEDQLQEARKTYPGRWESNDEREGNICGELLQARQTLEAFTGSEVSHLLFPWEEGSDLAVQLAKEAGYKSAFWGIIRGRSSNCPGDDPYRIPRLSWKFLQSLPGDGRKSLARDFAERFGRRIKSVVSN
jgi:peptidoglycan/xylan/chitin deacetylase (PgdA/CDA1 family)